MLQCRGSSAAYGELTKRAIISRELLGMLILTFPFLICFRVYICSSGDSGGPLITYMGREPIVVGIASNSVDCGTTTFPALFSRVSTVVPWMRQIGADFETN